MPRRKSFLRQFFTYWGLFALLALSVCAFALTIALSDATLADHLSNEGADAKATVTSLNMTSTRSNNRTRHHYEVGFSFTANGTVFLGKEDVSEDFYRSLSTRDIVPVRYWTKDPSLSEIEPGHRASQAQIGQIVAGVAAVLTVVFATLGWRWASQARWMGQNGIARDVAVTRLASAGIAVNKTPLYRIFWQDASGEGRSRPHRIKHLPAVGTMTTILTDPEGQRPSLWVNDL